MGGGDRASLPNPIIAALVEGKPRTNLVRGGGGGGGGWEEGKNQISVPTISTCACMCRTLIKAKNCDGACMTDKFTSL